MKPYLAIILGVPLLAGVLSNAAEVSPQNPTNTDAPVTTWTANSDNIFTVSANTTTAPFVVSTITAENATVNPNPSTTSASASDTRTFAAEPTTDRFPLTITGLFGGDGDKSPIRWTVTRRQKFFWLSPIEKIVKEGTSVSITANGDKTSSLEWTVSSTTPSWTKTFTTTSGAGITLNENFWTTNNITIPEGKTPPLAGQYSISAKTVEPSQRTASPGSTVCIIEITQPKKHGDVNKWLASSYKYDCQVLVLPSSVHLQPNLAVAGNWAGRSDGTWSVSSGTIADPSSVSTNFRHYQATKGITLSLRFAATGDTVIDTRTIDVFEDCLELGKANFGTGGYCTHLAQYTGLPDDTPWHPQSKYGVTGTDIDINAHWNCHGSAQFLYDGSGNGSGDASFANNWQKAVIGGTHELDYPFSSAVKSALTNLNRGDIVSFYCDAGHLQHTHTSTGGSECYGANNEPAAQPEPNDETWKWAQCTSEAYANGANQYWGPVSGVWFTANGGAHIVIRQKP